MTRALAVSFFVAFLALACTTTSEPEPAPAPPPVVEAKPAPPPAPEPVATPVAEVVRPAPRQLPKTAGVLPLVGLSGVAALGLGTVTRVVRRRLVRR